MSLLTGKCLCGAIAYQYDGEPISTANCHCSDCRSATGAAYSTICFIKSDQLKVDGETKAFEHFSDRGNKMTKHFCPNCGSQLFGENSARQGLIGIRAGTINQTNLVKPSRNVYISSKIASTPIDANIPASHKMPNN